MSASSSDTFYLRGRRGSQGSFGVEVDCKIRGLGKIKYQHIIGEMSAKCTPVEVCSMPCNSSSFFMIHYNPTEEVLYSGYGDSYGYGCSLTWFAVERYFSAEALGCVFYDGQT